MRVWALGAGLAAVAVGEVAYAQTWTADVQLMKERSRTGCGDGVPPSTLVVSGNKLTIQTSAGNYDFAIAGDGTVNQAFTATNGNALRLIGNARTRDLEIDNERGGCRYKLVAKQ